MHKPELIVENEMHKILWDFEIPDLVLINKQKITCYIMDFAAPTSHREKVKAGEKQDKYLDFAREQKVVGYEGDGDTKRSWGPRNSPYNLEKKLGKQEIRGRTETIQTTTRLKSARIRRVQETRGD